MAKLEFENLAAFKKMKAKQLPKGDWITVTQEMINAFALATLDRQWIHVDAKKAEKESPFKTTIAHGFMSVAMISSMITDLIRIKSMTMGVNYGLSTVRFPHPVPVGSRVRLLSSIKEIEDYSDAGAKVTWNCEVQIENISKPACVCEFIALVFEGEQKK
ncbi:MAG: MaoC family dehydratase [Proteobacteria bacterium]|nr:MaoC family dehydratase [Pseudomonadota bacterium]MBU1582985.1 MaoC family dehydratase [Pseudomonadota bacterium]MBU2456120.1 MaoC family dehydratase [Pseudomonadota bacterium]MBU2631778.1 MaoC family dehydratase [Pseudomonadota bacterium]